MTRVDIISGFLGAGKTTLIKKLIAEAYNGERLVLIENEFGEIGIDGGFMSEAGITVNEMNSGCICCSLAGDFEAALGQVLQQYAPDRIIIEPSGVGKLSDVRRAVQAVRSDALQSGSCITVVDATRCRMYIKNFGEFFIDQVKAADTIILSRTAGIDEARLAEAVELLRAHNAAAPIVTTDWNALSGAKMLQACADISIELHQHSDDEHHHHHHEHCHCHECEHDHEHEHHHEHCDGEHHHHHADEVFESFGAHTVHAYDEQQLRAALEQLSAEGARERYGDVLRAKGYVACTDGGWLHFDYVPGEAEVRRGEAEITGSLCVIGSSLSRDALCELFNVSEGV